MELNWSKIALIWVKPICVYKTLSNLFEINQEIQLSFHDWPISDCSKMQHVCIIFS